MSATDDDDLRDFYANGYQRLTGRLADRHSRQWAEDLVQEALLRAWERASGGENPTSLPAWVATVATNLARSQLRRQDAERGALQRLVANRPAWLVGRIDGPDQAVDDIVDLLAHLPTRQREVLTLRYVTDLDIASIALLMGIDEGTVKSTLSRGRHAQVADHRDIRSQHMHSRRVARRQKLRRRHRKPRGHLLGPGAASSAQRQPVVDLGPR